MKLHTPMVVTIVMAVLAVIGWTLHWHITINDVHQASAAPKPNGLVSVPQCAQIKTGMTEDQVVSLLGMPKGDTQDNGFSDASLAYPLEEDSSRTCTIGFNSGDTNKVIDVTVDLVTPTL